MPNMKNAKKAVKQDNKISEKNRHYNSTMRNAIRNTDKAITSGDKEKATANLNNAIKALDKAHAKGLVHKNKVAREKSRLTKKVNSMEVK